MTPEAMSACSTAFTAASAWPKPPCSWRMRAIRCRRVQHRTAKSGGSPQRSASSLPSPPDAGAVFARNIQPAPVPQHQPDQMAEHEQRPTAPGCCSCHTTRPHTCNCPAASASFLHGWACSLKRSAACYRAGKNAAGCRVSAATGPCSMQHHCSAWRAQACTASSLPATKRACPHGASKGVSGMP